MPLGLLPIALVAPNGSPESGATVTLTSLAASPCPLGDAYNLPPTDVTGVTMTSVPYGSYSYTVTQGNTAVAYTSVTIVVGPDSVQVQSINAGPWVTYYLPSLVTVAG